MNSNTAKTRTEEKLSVALYAIIAANVLAACLYGFILYGIYSEKSRAENALTALLSEIKKGESLKNISSALLRTAGEVQKINSYFVGTKGLPGFLGQVREFGNKAGTAISIGNVDIEDGALRIDFSADGSFASVYRLIQILETTPYSIEMKSMNISKTNEPLNGKKGDKDSLWKGTFSIRLLSFKNE